MFLYRSPTQWIREACFFNLVNRTDAQTYNLLLSFEGRGIRVLKQKEWGTTGFAAPDFNSPDGDGGFDIRIKDDAFYVFVLYDRAADCPFKAPHRAELHASQVLVNGKPVAEIKHMTEDEVMVIEVGDGDTNESVLKKIEDAESKKRRREVVIDVSAEPVAKEKKAPKPKKGAVGKKTKEAAVVDFTKKRASKAKTVGEAQEILVDGAIADLKLKVEDTAKKMVKAIKGAGKQGQGDMVGYLADQIRVDPEGSKKLLAQMIKDRPDMFGGQTPESLASRILAMDNGVATPPKGAIAAEGGKTSKAAPKANIDRSPQAKRKAPAKKTPAPAPKGGKKRKD